MNNSESQSKEDEFAKNPRIQRTFLHASKLFKGKINQLIGVLIQDHMILTIIILINIIGTRFLF